LSEAATGLAVSDPASSGRLVEASAPRWLREVHERGEIRIRGDRGDIDEISGVLGLEV
jgi:hypothetical protein